MLFLPTCPRPRVRCKLSGDCTPRVLPRASRSGRHVGLRPPRNDKETWWVCKPIVGEGQCPSQRFCVQNRIAAGNPEILFLWAGHCPAPTENCKFTVIPRAGRPVGIRSLAPRVYEGGAPTGAGGEKSHSTELPQSRLSPCQPPLKSGGQGCGANYRGLPRPRWGLAMTR